MPLGYIPDPMPASEGLECEDNYQILVYDRPDGELLGVALRTSMNGITQKAMTEAVERYPGRHLVETNGQFILRAFTAPTGIPNQFGWIEGNDMPLEHLPQWYGLIAECKCGYLGRVDRYDPHVLKWKSFPLSKLATKLSCDECKRRRRPKQPITIHLEKLPR